MLYTVEDQRFMAKAIALAQQPLFAPHPNPRVGCVLVNDTSVVGEGFHACHGSAHAEQMALAQAGKKARGARAYVTLEPCNHQGNTPPCTRELLQARVGSVYYATGDPNALASGGARVLKEQGVKIFSGLLREQAEAINRGFFHFMRTGKPWVRIKMAMSLDGHTALKSGESQWITSIDSRQDVHRFRAQSAAIITGIGSIAKDDSRLTVRLSEPVTHDSVPAQQQPLRVILDTNGRLLPQAACLQAPGKIWVYTAEKGLVNRLRANKRCTVKIIPLSNKQLDLSRIVHELASSGYYELMVEAGPQLAGSFLQSNLVNEIILYVSPKLLGHEASGLFQLSGIESLQQAYPLKFQEFQKIGEDLRLIVQVLTT